MASTIAQSRLLNIRAKAREFPFQIARLPDFAWDESDAIDPREMIRDPYWSLYSLNSEVGCAVFVRLDPNANLSEYPFFYQAQYENTRALAVVPYDDFHMLADSIELDDRRLIMVHSTGRCGSTLISKVFDAVPEVHGISEPDVLTLLTTWRPFDHSRDDFVARMLRSSIKLLCKPRPGAAAQFWAIKPRSQVIELADLLQKEFPRSRDLYIYRDGLMWLTSVFRSFLRDRPLEDEEKNRWIETAFAEIHPLVKQYVRPEKAMSPACLWILGWISGMEAYLRLRAAGSPIRAVRFEDIKAQPRPVMEKIFEHCGIAPADWAPVLEALAKDSQEGSFVAQSKVKEAEFEVDPKYIEEARSIITGRDALSGPGMILPDTIAMRDERR